MNTTTRAEQIALNDHVLKALGLHDQRGLLTEVVLTLQPGKMPTVRLERALSIGDMAALSNETAWLELQLATVPAAPVFDAGAACDAALARLGQAIEADAIKAMGTIRNSLVDLRYHLHEQLSRAEASLRSRRHLLDLLDAMHDAEKNSSIQEKK